MKLKLFFRLIHLFLKRTHSHFLRGGATPNKEFFFFSPFSHGKNGGFVYNKYWILCSQISRVCQRLDITSERKENEECRELWKLLGICGNPKPDFPTAQLTETDSFITQLTRDALSHTHSYFFVTLFFSQYKKRLCMQTGENEKKWQNVKVLYACIQNIFFSAKWRRLPNITEGGIACIW